MFAASTSHALLMSHSNNLKDVPNDKTLILIWEKLELLYMTKALIWTKVDPVYQKTSLPILNGRK